MNLYTIEEELKLMEKCPNYEKKSKVPRIFVIGFNKCATASIHFFFLLNNIKSIHWYRGLLDNEINKNITKNENNLLGNLNNYYVYSDCEALRKNFKLFEEKYPNSKFILNTRNVDNWILSRLNHCNGNYLKYWNKINNKNLNLKQTIKYWKEEWFNHHNDVKNYFKDISEKLLIIDIEKDDFQQKIINFIGTEYLEKKNIYIHKTIKKKYKKHDI